MTTIPRAGRPRRWWPVLLSAALILAAAPVARSGPHGEDGSPGREDRDHRLPVLRVEPADGTAPVRPDAVVRIAFDPADPDWPRYAHQLRQGHYRLTVNGEPVPARFDPAAATLTATPALARYTPYRVQLAVGPAARSASPRGLPPPADARLAFSFATGSAPHEPRRVTVEALDRVPVTEPAAITVRALDDYGQPAAATVTVELAEHGARRPGSARAEPAEARLEPAGGGEVRVLVTDREAEAVAVTLRVAGPYPDDRDDHALGRLLRFDPGPPAVVSPIPSAYEAAAEPYAGARPDLPGEVILAGEVADAYGNPTPATLWVERHGSASGPLPDLAAEAGPDGRFALALRSPRAEYQRVRVRVVGGPSADLPWPLRFVRPLGPGSAELTLRAAGGDAPDPVQRLPVARAPDLVEGPPGSGRGGYVEVLLDDRPLGGAPVAADGGFRLRTARPFAPGDLLVLRFHAAAPVRWERRSLHLAPAEWLAVVREVHTGAEDAYYRTTRSGRLPVGELEWYAYSQGREFTVTHRWRLLLRFPPAPVPPGSRVLAATLEASVARESLSVYGGTLTVAPLGGPWHGDTRWSTQPPLAAPGVGRQANLERCPVARLAWDVTPFVRAWVAGDLPDHGLLLHAGEPGRPEGTRRLAYDVYLTEGGSPGCGAWTPPLLRLEVEVPVS